MSRQLSDHAERIAALLREFKLTAADRPAGAEDERKPP